MDQKDELKAYFLENLLNIYPDKEKQITMALNQKDLTQIQLPLNNIFNFLKSRNLDIIQWSKIRICKEQYAIIRIYFRRLFHEEMKNKDEIYQYYKKIRQIQTHEYDYQTSQETKEFLQNHMHKVTDQMMSLNTSQNTSPEQIKSLKKTVKYIQYIKYKDLKYEQSQYKQKLQQLKYTIQQQQQQHSSV